MTALFYLLGVVLFVLAILASIGLHELGHLVPAKKFGGKVTEYFIGFGPTLWSTRRGETEYGLKAIPLGGYVKIVGMLPPGAEALAETTETDADGVPVHTVRKSNTGMFTQLISDARAAEWERITSADEDRLFYTMPWWKKVVVMAGGPTVNLAIAFVIFLGVFSTYGNPDPREAEVVGGQPVLAAVSECVIPYGADRLTCEAGDPVAPAAEAGLRPGDAITTFNGTPVTGWDQLRSLIRDNEGGDAVIGYERDGRALSGTTNTTVQARPTSQTDETLVEVGFLGVVPATERATGGALYTLGEMGEMTRDTVVAIGTLPVKVWDVAQAVVGLQERAQDSPVSVVGGGRIAGEVASEATIPGVDRAVLLLMLVAGFNLFIGMFNFVPLLPLDGGHIAGALWEAVRRGVARLRRRPDPGYVDVAKLLPVAYVFASVLLVMGVVLIVADLVVPIDVLGS